MPNDQEILDEIKKALGLLNDNTYVVEDFQQHLLTFIKDNFQKTIAVHKEQVERLLKDITELRPLQVKYFATKHKRVLFDCMEKETALDNKCKALLRSGYSIDWLIKAPPAQGGLF